MTAQMPSELKLAVALTVTGYMMMGVICILCINGSSGRAGWWIPEWFLDTHQTRKDWMALCAWWLGVLLLWPLILPLVTVMKCVSITKTWYSTLSMRVKSLFHLSDAHVEEEEANQYPTVDDHATAGKEASAHQVYGEHESV